MSSTVLYMSMSLDGYVTGPNEGPDQRSRRRRGAAARVDLSKRRAGTTSKAAVGRLREA